METALSIIQSGSVKRPGIGILYVELSAEDAAEQKVPQGKQVQSFMPDSPAEVAGLEKGDVIVRCNGVTLSEQDILVDTIRAATRLSFPCGARERCLTSRLSWAT